MIESSLHENENYIIIIAVSHPTGLKFSRLIFSGVLVLFNDQDLTNHATYLKCNKPLKQQLNLLKVHVLALMDMCHVHMT